MKPLLLLTVCLTMSLAVSSGSAQAQTAPAHPNATVPILPTELAREGYVLIQDWDFGQNIKTKADLERTFWTRYIFDSGRQDHLPANGEWQRYREADNHRLTNSTLDLVAHLRRGMVNGGIESGMLRSKWTGKYGYFECRMKLPHGRGMWPAFWLTADDAIWPPEIDVMEVVNNGKVDTRTSYHGLFPGRSDKVQTVFSKLDRWNAYSPGVDYADGFHVFAVEWTPDRVRHFVDGVLIAERVFHWVHDDGSDAGPAHVLVNLAVGGRWPGPPLSATDFPASLSIDYIRVWQKR